MSETILLNDGQRQLIAALSERGAAAQLARNIGVADSLVTRWLKGVQPDANNRVKLSNELKIDFKAWSAKPATKEDGAA